MGERRYNEKELAQILREATKKQAANAEGPADDPGYSLAEIQRLAAEVGVEPRYIAEVAGTMSESQPGRFQFWRTKPRLILERTIPGELSDGAWDDIVAELRASVGIVGSASASGATREWVAHTDTSVAHFAATARQGQTKLRLTFGQEGGIMAAWVVGMAATFVISLMTGTFAHKAGADSPVATAYALLVALAAAVLINVGVTRWGSKNKRMVDELMPRLESLATRAQPTDTRVTTELETSQPVVDSMLNY